MTTTFLFLRHGNTSWTEKGIYYGASDIKMNDRGYHQIQKAAGFLENRRIDTIISSPLQRCSESARIINELIRQEIIYEPQLAEMNFGIFEGLGYEEITAGFPEEYKSWTSDWIEYPIPSGESLRQTYTRVVKALEEIKKSHQGKTVLIVSHGGVIRAALAHYLTGSLEHYWKFSVQPASITEVHFEDDFPVLKGLINTF